MSKLLRAVGSGCTVALAVAGYVHVQAARLDDKSPLIPVSNVQSERSQPSLSSGITPERALLDQYCITCHNERLKTAGVALETVEIGQVNRDAATWERVLRKVRSGDMPPAGRPEPDEAARHAFVSSVETALDRAAAENPDPGRPTLHRLNRAEYANAIRDLLVVEIDGRALLPADNIDHGFDNIADALSVSPGLLERYMSAARKIARLAIGDPAIAPSVETYRVPYMALQDDRVSERLPFGSRGGAAIRHIFPLDGEYRIRIRLQRNVGDIIRGLSDEHQLEIRVDGERVKTFTVGGKDDRARLAGADAAPADAGLEVRVPLKAGTRLVGVSFAAKPSLSEGVIQPPLTDYGRGTSTAGNPLVESVDIAGPYNVTGPGDTPSRGKIFVCRPTNEADETRCATTIVSTLARRAYRRPLTKADIETALGFYKAGRSEGSFDAGIQFATERILSAPSFLFRIERDPAPVAARTPYRLSDVELASRLSFFLWSSIPDDELLDVAARGALKDPTVLEQQVRRMLRDPRSSALVSNFGGQWLWIRNVQQVTPDPNVFLEFDDTLREAFQQETILFLESLLREDRSVLELLTADYTFLNERLARHYGIPNVYGSRFRRVALGNVPRRGLLGQGSFLIATSYPNRTSPVLRGKWLLENLIGTPPPSPPPNVPPFPESGQGGKPTSVRERMEQHRKNPACAGCHARMDPLGFALEHFDGIGQWRDTEGNESIDAKSVLADGTQVNGADGVINLLLSHRQEFVGTVTERLLTYALGRQVEYFDAPAIRKITREAAADGDRWSALILGIVNSVPFQTRRSE